jgi:hypothetical protein
MPCKQVRLPGAPTGHGIRAGRVGRGVREGEADKTCFAPTGEGMVRRAQAAHASMHGVRPDGAQGEGRGGWAGCKGGRSIRAAQDAAIARMLRPHKQSI